jgi:hypothetical protein
MGGCQEEVVSGQEEVVSCQWSVVMQEKFLYAYCIQANFFH